MDELTEEANEIVTGLSRKCYQDKYVEHDFAEYDIHLKDIGWGREVYTLPAKYVCGSDAHSEYVIKILQCSMNSESDGLEQNREEINAWEDRLKSYRNNLVPIIDYHPSGWWILMPYVDIVDIDSLEGEERKQELEEMGFKFEDEVELGRYDGELLLIDYGYRIDVND